MASTKEIRGKIASVENTQKITSAMEMVATSKMRAAQEAMNFAKPYTRTLKRVISHISKAKPNANNPYVKPREVKHACFVVVATDRGLCGGLNINLFKQVLASYSEYTQNNIQVDFAVIGNKALDFFQRMDVPIVYSLKDIGDAPKSELSLGFTQGIVEDYLEGKYDLVELFSNKYVNTMSQLPKRKQYLPLPQLPQEVDSVDNGDWDYIFEGDENSLLTDLINRYVVSQLHAAILESQACEQAARMIAMKAATDNASQMIDELKLVYNKARQFSITNELNEIVAGAAAV